MCDSRFGTADGIKNTVGPVLRLARLADDELLALMVRMTALHAQYYGITERVSGEDQLEFMRICMRRAGADMMITPREMLRDYMTLLNVLMQNPDKSFADIAGALSDAAGAPNTPNTDGGVSAPARDTAVAGNSSRAVSAAGDTAQPTEGRAAFDPSDIDY